MISEQEWKQMYINEKMSMYDIAKTIGVSYGTVYNRLKKYGIKRRTITESMFKGVRKLSREELENMYWKQEMTLDEIAKVIGVFHATINDWMQEHGIEKRTRSEALLKGARKPSKEELNQMYWSRRMSRSEIAIEIGVSVATIGNWMKKHEIEARTVSEAIINGNFAGENSPGWRGGISFEPYCVKFNNKFKEAVRERDDYTCQLCGRDQEPGGRRLSVHHIHYDKSDCWPDVVALCRSCHAKTTSGDRDYWEQYFENQLSERGLTCWSISQEINNT